MRRIVIVGCPGTGKTTFARELAKKTKLPLIHLDKLYWKPGWVRTPKDDWEKIQRKEVIKDSWIIEGNYVSSLPIRFERADTFIFLDYPKWIALCRSFKRRIMFHGKQRKELGQGNPERLTWINFDLFYPIHDRECWMQLIHTNKKTL